MLPVVAQFRMSYADPADLACGAMETPETASMVGCALGLAAIAFAWWYRPRVAREGDQNTWAAIALLIGVAQVLTAMWLVPMGCLSGHALSSFVGYASPWIISAGLFRSAIVPTSPLPRSGDGRSGDPFT